MAGGGARPAAAPIRRVGVLMGYAENNPTAQAQVAALRQELQKLGWQEGRSVRVDVRFPGTDAGRVRAMLIELISLTPDVLVCNSNLVTAIVQAEVRTHAGCFRRHRRSAQGLVLSATKRVPTATSRGSLIGICR